MRCQVEVEALLSVVHQSNVSGLSFLGSHSLMSDPAFVDPRRIESEELSNGQKRFGWFRIAPCGPLRLRSAHIKRPVTGEPLKLAERALRGGDQELRSDALRREIVDWWVARLQDPIAGYRFSYRFARKAHP